MDKNLLKRIILNNQSLIASIKVTERDISLERNANYIFVGPRRAGKTYLLYQIIQKNYLNDLEKVLYINFEDERLIELNHKSLQLILDSYAELYPHKPILFFDEIQNIEHWEKFVRRLADEKYRIFITGSNSTMLSGQMASTLGGRFMIKEILPLSFKEFLKFNRLTLDKNFQFSPQAVKIKKLFNTYLKYGGFPELIHFDNKQAYLSNLYRKLLFGDIITRYQIKNIKAIQLIIKKIAESVNNETSVNRIKNLIKSIGIPVGASTVFEYLHYLKESYLLFSIENFSHKFVERESKKKYYFVDNGLLNLFLFDQDTKLLENLVYLHLRRKYREIFYYKRNREVDFYIPQAELLIQVSYDITDIETEKREVVALYQAQRELKVKKLLIITHDTQKDIEYKNLHINVIPAYEYLLS